MKLSDVKQQLEHMDHVVFELPNGKQVPAHFHVTEVGKISRHFIDCGGTIRQEEVVNFQLWSSIDYHHRLGAEKLLNIIRLSEEKLGIGDLKVEVEYQGETIGKYGLSVNDSKFVLTNTHTDCLAKSDCGIPPVIKEAATAIQQQAQSCCSPNGGCC